MLVSLMFAISYHQIVYILYVHRQQGIIDRNTKWKELCSMTLGIFLLEY
jgi:hypothetical protein